MRAGCIYYYGGREFTHEEFKSHILGDRDLLKKYVPDSKTDIPETPFKKTESWMGLGIKKALRMAVEDKMDVLAWVPGEIQAERYDLSKQVDSIAWNEKTGEFAAYKGSGVLPIIEQENVTAEKLPDLIGKEAARKLIETTPRKDSQGETRWLEGEELKVGGEGMKGFYDKILPDFVRKYVKKWNSKVEKTQIDAEQKRDAWKAWDESGKALLYRDENGASIYFPKEELARDAIKGTKGTMSHTLETIPTEVWSITITDAMKESVLGGQARFMPRKSTVEEIERGGTVVKVLRGEDGKFVASPSVVAAINPGKERGFNPGFTPPQRQEVTQRVLKAITTESGSLRFLDELGIPNSKIETTGSWGGEEEPSFAVKLPGMGLKQAKELATLIGDALLQDAAIASQPIKDGPQIGVLLRKADGAKMSKAEIKAFKAEMAKDGRGYTIRNDGESVTLFDDAIWENKDYSEADADAFILSLASAMKAANLTHSIFRQDSESINQTDYANRLQETRGEASNGGGRRSNLLRAANDYLYGPSREAFQKWFAEIGYQPTGQYPNLRPLLEGIGQDQTEEPSLSKIKPKGPIAPKVRNEPGKNQLSLFQ